MKVEEFGIQSWRLRLFDFLVAPALVWMLFCARLTRTEFVVEVEDDSE